MVSVVPSGELSPDPSMASVKQNEVIWVILVDIMRSALFFYTWCQWDPTEIRASVSTQHQQGGMRWWEVGLVCFIFAPPPQCQWGPVGSWTFTSTLEQKSGLNHSQLLLPYLYPHSEVIRWCMSGGCPYFFQEGVNETKRIAELPPQLSETRQWASTFWFCWSGISGAQQKAPCTYPPRCHTTHQQGDWLLKTKIK